MLVKVLVYGLLWGSFGAVHSALAAPAGRRRLARWAGAADRLAYNLIAIVHLAVVLGLGGVLFAGTGFDLPPALRFAGAMLAILGVVVLSAAGRSYDFARFAGIAQFRAGAPDAAAPPEPLATGGMNAIVRHPLYLGVLLILWGVATTPLRLATAIAATAYILIGIRFEERNLIRRYGDAYRTYRARVPMLLPRWPQRH